MRGGWIESPIVAIGTIDHISSYGEQYVDHLPWPVTASVHKLYWCQGDFRLTAVVKGQLRSPPKKYLWASTIPGCELWSNDPRLRSSREQTRAWFLREEGGLLRPTFDNGTYRYVGLLAKWDDGPDLPARERLGLLLLRPDANGDTPEDFAKYLWDVGDIACELLGKPECADRIRAITLLGSPSLTEAACNFLSGQLGAGCVLPK